MNQDLCRERGTLTLQHTQPPDRDRLMVNLQCMVFSANNPSLHFSLSLSLQDLQKIIYMDNNTAGLLDTECLNSGNGEKADPQTSETRTGIRTVCVSPDGQHLASGDRTGTLRYCWRKRAVCSHTCSSVYGRNYCRMRNSSTLVFLITPQTIDWIPLN